MINRELLNISCKDYCIKNSYKYSVIEKEEKQKVYIPNYNIDFEQKYEEFDFPEIAVAELFKVKVIGGNDIVYDDMDNCIYDLPLREDFYRYDLVYNSIFYIDRRVTCVSYNESNEDIEEAIMLTGVVSHNYYHFNLESLARLCLINTMKEYDDVPILIDEVIQWIPQLYEELLLLNEGKRKIYFLKSRHSYNIKKLIYISKLIFIPLNIKNPYKPVYKDLVIKDLAVKLIHHNLSLSNSINRRLFISRKDSWNPRLKNTDEIEGIFKEFGYEFIFPGQMSFEEQRRIFSQAEYIAGATGAAFTNLLFANKRATLICIVPQISQVPCYSNISGILGQKYYFIDAVYERSIFDQDNNTIYENTFIVDPQYVKRVLAKIHNQYSDETEK